jgi:hypothetical protein
VGDLPILEVSLREEGEKERKKEEERKTRGRYKGRKIRYFFFFFEKLQYIWKTNLMNWDLTVC